jgi:hypothetical protein
VRFTIGKNLLTPLSWGILYYLCPYNSVLPLTLSLDGRGTKGEGEIFRLLSAGGEEVGTKGRAEKKSRESLP